MTRGAVCRRPETQWRLRPPCGSEWPRVNITIITIFIIIIIVVIRRQQQQQ